MAQLFDQYATAFLSRQRHLRYGALQPEELSVSVGAIEARAVIFQQFRSPGRLVGAGSKEERLQREFERLDWAVALPCD